MKAVVLDTGALIALEGRKGRALALAAELLSGRREAHVPTGVVAQVWRGSSRQHSMIRLIRTGAVRSDPMTEDVALRIGLLLASSGTRDVVDGHVALLARKLNASVITSDPDDIAKLDPALELVPI